MPQPISIPFLPFFPEFFPESVFSRKYDIRSVKMVFGVGRYGNFPFLLSSLDMSTLVTASQRSVVLEKNGYTHIDELLIYHLLLHYVCYRFVMQILDNVNLYRTWAKIRKVRNSFSRCFLQK